MPMCKYVESIIQSVSPEFRHPPYHKISQSYTYLGRFYADYTSSIIPFICQHNIVVQF